MKTYYPFHVHVFCKNYKESTFIKCKVLKKSIQLSQVLGSSNNLITENNRTKRSIFEYIRARHNKTVKQMGCTDKLHAINYRKRMKPWKTIKLRKNTCILKGTVHSLKK